MTLIPNQAILDRSVPQDSTEWGIGIYLSIYFLSLIAVMIICWKWKIFQ